MAVRGRRAPLRREIAALRLLLDTHVAVWAVTGDRRLAPATLTLITEVDAVAVSIASLWEVAVKNNLGR